MPPHARPWLGKGTRPRLPCVPGNGQVPHRGSRWQNWASGVGRFSVAETAGRVLTIGGRGCISSCLGWRRGGWGCAARPGAPRGGPVREGCTGRGGSRPCVDGGGGTVPGRPVEEGRWGGGWQVTGTGVVLPGRALRSPGTRLPQSAPPGVRLRPGAPRARGRPGSRRCGGPAHPCSVLFRPLRPARRAWYFSTRAGAERGVT